MWRRPHPCGRMLVQLDTYEDADGLNDWGCRALVPALPATGRICLSGRNELARRASTGQIWTTRLSGILSVSVSQEKTAATWLTTG